MSGKFKKVPVEEGTKILFHVEAKLGERPVLYQKWYWDGITAESIIFAAEDVAGLSDKDIENDVRNSPLLQEGSKLTLSRSDAGFVFVNFNFVSS